MALLLHTNTGMQQQHHKHHRRGLRFSPFFESVSRDVSASTNSISYRRYSMIIYTIYKATNKVTGKCYIGFAKDFERRKGRHKIEANCVGQPGYKTYFHRSIRKYGWSNFYWSILYQSPELNYCKNVMENYFIVENNSYIKSKNSNGYNMTLGGEGTFGYYPTHTRESIEKIRSSSMGKNLGKTHSDESKILMGQNRKGTSSWNNGITNYHTEKSLLNISDAAKILIECPYCNISTNRGNAKRWHFDNCKMKGNI